MENFLNIRYCKLTFTLEFLEDTCLPERKVSMLRGGIGEMLLRGNCIGNRDCESCGFREECVVQQIYYHRLKIVPDYVQGKESLGYLYECGDTRTDFHKGDTLRFHMTLFGNVIVHFPAILQAVYWLGRSGMGKENATFRVDKIENQRGEKVLFREEVRLGCLQPDLLSDYVADRRKKVAEPVKMRFVMPLTQKFEGEFLREFRAEALATSIYRRIYLLNCMEGNEMERSCPYLGALDIVDQRVKTVRIPRYSGTQDKVIRLEGIEGCLVIRAAEEFVPYLLAGELAHIGKNTSMGFGQYIVE